MAKKPTAREMVEYSKDNGDEDTSWVEDAFGEADPRATSRIHRGNFNDKLKEEFPRNYEDEPSVRTRAYSERAKDFGSEGQVGKKDGGMVKAKKSGVRGAGCAAKGHGKMKMY